MTTTAKHQIQITPEIRQHSPEFKQCVQHLVGESPQTREETAKVVREYGFPVYVGGCHVAILRNIEGGGCERIALITSSAPDFS